jgi:hypothetical protein
VTLSFTTRRRFWPAHQVSIPPHNLLTSINRLYFSVSYGKQAACKSRKSR